MNAVVVAAAAYLVLNIITIIILTVNDDYFAIYEFLASPIWLWQQNC